MAPHRISRSPRPRRWLVAIVALAPVLTGAPAFGAGVPFRHSCGQVGGVPVTAYNLSCARARAIWRPSSGSQGVLPRGWTGANLDRAGGEALLFPSRYFNRVTRAEARFGLNLEKLGTVPVVLALVPYGDSLRPG